MSEWISVKDRLPEITHIVRDNGDGYSDDVLMLFTDGTIEVIEFELRDGVVETGHGNSLDIVTHWMPLPEPPKEEK